MSDKTIFIDGRDKNKSIRGFIDIGKYLSEGAAADHICQTISICPYYILVIEYYIDVFICNISKYLMCVLVVGSLFNIYSYIF